MIYVGIDVAKNKHDCFITNSDGEILFKPFTIPNNLEGFDNLYHKIESTTNDPSKVKVGLEATGHYNYNLLGYLIDKGMTTYVINPLHTNLFRKSQSLRQTKTDKVDARTIASMLMSDVNLKSYVTCCEKTCACHFPFAKDRSIIRVISSFFLIHIFFFRAPLLMLYLSCSFHGSDCNEKSLPLFQKI